MQTANQYLEICKNIIIKDIFFDDSLFDKCHISYGFPSRKALAAKNKTIGQAWQQGEIEAIFISPVIFSKKNDIEVIATLIHELIHIKLGPDKGHRGGFKALMNSTGLEGKATATKPSKKLIGKIQSLNFPEMPCLHLDKTNQKKPGSRSILYQCSCGRKLRIAIATAEQGDIFCGICSETFKAV